jgi:hypothetical protein
MTQSTWEAGVPHNELRWPSSLPKDKFLEPLSQSNVLVEMDAARFMAEVRTRALWWIPQMGHDILKVNEALKTVSEYRIAARTRKYPRDSQLDINEAERRLEHRLGQMIIEGQKEGIFHSAHDSKNRSKISVREYLGFTHTGTQGELREIGKLTQGELEDLLEKARQTGELSRRAVLRLCRGEVVLPNRSKFNAGRRRIDSNKVIQSLAEDLEAATSGLAELVVPEDLDLEIKIETKAVIWAAIARITEEMGRW